MSRAFHTATVLGAGTMGAQIAAHLANAGVAVRLLDVTIDAARQGLARARALKPDPFFVPDAAALIRLGSFDDLEDASRADWIVEAVIEDLGVKQQLAARLDAARAPHTIVSSNTSGIPLALVAQGRTEGFRRHWLGTHFFNPPRYLKLVELIPTADTDAAVVDALADFADRQLGKGVVVARDTPAFIANHLGVFGVARLLDALATGGFTIEEIDAVTGPAIGRPKSATFRTIDIAGLDILAHVAHDLARRLPNEEDRGLFALPPFVDRMIERQWLGAKTGRGFYMRAPTDAADGERRILTLDTATLEYRERRPAKMPEVEAAMSIPKTADRIRALFLGQHRAGALLRATLGPTLLYAARVAPEIAFSIDDIDRAMRWGFGWELGPFETWDAIGIARVLEACGGGEPPSLTQRRRDAGDDPLSLTQRREDAGEERPSLTQRRRDAGDDPLSLTQRREDAGEERPSLTQRRKDAGEEPPSLTQRREGEGDDRFSLTQRREDAGEGRLILTQRRRGAGKTASTILKTNAGASLVDLGDGVLCVEFHSKMNTIGGDAIEMLHAGVREATANFTALVVGNDAEHFSAGANLMLLLLEAQESHWDEVDLMVRAFQGATMALKMSPVPVVAAPAGLAIGGGCELCLHADRVQAAAETYIGLVEAGVGLIPAGGGTKEMVLRMTDLRTMFETIGLGRVSTSAPDARRLGYLREVDSMSMNRDRVMADAKAVALIRAQTYQPPAPRDAIPVGGADAFALLSLGVHLGWRAGRLSDHDALIGRKLAWVMTGGDVAHKTTVSEGYLLDLEREAFLSLCGERKTLERIGYTLKTGQTLRN